LLSISPVATEAQIKKGIKRIKNSARRSSRKNDNTSRTNEVFWADPTKIGKYLGWLEKYDEIVAKLKREFPDLNPENGAYLIPKGFTISNLISHIKLNEKQSEISKLIVKRTLKGEVESALNMKIEANFDNHGLIGKTYKKVIGVDGFLPIIKTILPNDLSIFISNHTNPTGKDLIDIIYEEGCPTEKFNEINRYIGNTSLGINLYNSELRNLSNIIRDVVKLIQASPNICFTTPPIK
jgi:hypothetical protein